MASVNVFPDFRYDTNTLEYRDISGWKLFCDYISKEPRFEKLTNYIQVTRKANLERKL